MCANTKQQSSFAHLQDSKAHHQMVQSLRSKRRLSSRPATFPSPESNGATSIYSHTLLCTNHRNSPCNVQQSVSVIQWHQRLGKQHLHVLRVEQTIDEVAPGAYLSGIRTSLTILYLEKLAKRHRHYVVSSGKTKTQSDFFLDVF